VRLRSLMLLVLLVPGLALGPGWSLRFCAEELLGTLGCCTEASVSNCCPTETRTPLEPPTGIAAACDRCCIDITTLDEQPVPTQEPLAHVVERTQAAALAIAVPSSDVPLVHLAHEGSAWAAAQLPPAPPGRCTPLPLRI
jgi:hypothetical protein